MDLRYPNQERFECIIAQKYFLCSLPRKSWGALRRIDECRALGFRVRGIYPPSKTLPAPKDPIVLGLSALQLCAFVPH